MKVNQIYELVNSTVSEVLGKEDLLLEDLTNIVEVGKEVIDTNNIDNYTRKLVNHIGKVVFVNKKYNGNVPSVLLDGWEYGSILEKISADLPTATENDSWKLTDGESYDPNVFYQPKVSSKFFNSKVTFEIPMSFTEKQIKESFSNAEQLNGFISMLFNSVENAITVKVDNLIMRTINSMIGETMFNDLKASDSDKLVLTNTTPKAVNLLALYNTASGNTVKAEKAMFDPDFIRFSSYIISLYTGRISKISTLFNVGGKERFTSKDDLHVVLLEDFASASKIFLESGTYNNELVTLPSYESVPYWQGSGKNYDLKDTSKIKVKITNNKVVEVPNILGVMFDTQALGVTNLDKRVTTNYNPKAEFYTNFYKVDSAFFNDLNENFVVFFMG